MFSAQVWAWRHTNKKNYLKKTEKTGSSETLWSYWLKLLSLIIEMENEKEFQLNFKKSQLFIFLLTIQSPVLKSVC